MTTKTNEKIKIVVVEPNKKPYIKEINNELSELQSIVAGYIECISYSKGIDIVVNEEGLIHQLEPNRVVGEQVLFGTFFLTGVDYNSGEFVDLEEKLLDRLVERFTQSYIDGGI